jgi:hypothetical protein
VSFESVFQLTLNSPLAWIRPPRLAVDNERSIQLLLGTVRVPVTLEGASATTCAVSGGILARFVSSRQPDTFPLNVICTAPGTPNVVSGVENPIDPTSESHVTTWSVTSMGGGPEAVADGTNNAPAKAARPAIKPIRMKSLM